MPPPVTGGRSATAERTHPRLWARVKKKWHEGDKGGEAGKWNARKAQLAVQEYKRKSQEKHGDSGYSTPKPGKGNSLRKWTDEEWGYIDDKKGNRYLPKAVRDGLTPAQKRTENRRKKGKLGERVPYSEPVKAKMRESGVF